MNGIALSKFNGTEISLRSFDGFVHATAMCRVAGKRLNDYKRMKATREYLAAVSVETGIPVSTLISVKRGNPTHVQQGTWVHPMVAIHLAQWISPKFSIFVTKLVLDWQSGELETKQAKVEAAPVRELPVYERPEMLTHDHIAVMRYHINVNIENSWPKSHTPRAADDYFHKISQHFGVMHYHEILDEDFQEAMKVIDSLTPKSDKNYIVLHEHEDKLQLNDLQMFERSLYNSAKSLLNMIRSRPVLEPKPNVVRFENSGKESVGLSDSRGFGLDIKFRQH